MSHEIGLQRQPTVMLRFLSFFICVLKGSWNLYSDFWGTIPTPIWCRCFYILSELYRQLGNESSYSVVCWKMEHLNNILYKWQCAHSVSWDCGLLSSYGDFLNFYFSGYRYVYWNIWLLTYPTWRILTWSCENEQLLR